MAAFTRTGRSIVAIGRNYAQHAAELGNKAPTEPFFFLKPTSSYLPSGGQIRVPQGVEAHYEVELGVVIGAQARDVPLKTAMDHIAGYTVAIDMTARNMQEAAKKKGLPWSACKGFDTFCPVSDFVPKDQVPDPHALELELAVNGEIKQKGPTSDMIFDIPTLIHHCSSIMTLSEGDLLLTGTPAGVGRVQAGDSILASLAILESQKKLASWSGTVVDRMGGYAFAA